MVVGRCFKLNLAYFLKNVLLLCAYNGLHMFIISSLFSLLGMNIYAGCPTPTTSQECFLIIKGECSGVSACVGGMHAVHTCLWHWGLLLGKPTPPGLYLASSLI